MRHKALQRILSGVIFTLMPGICSLAAEPRPLTTDGRAKRDVTVLRGGEEILFVAQHSAILQRLERLRLADRAITVVHPESNKGEFEPSVSPDGKYLAFIQGRGNLSLALVIEEVAAKKQFDLPPAGGFAGYRAPAIAPNNGRVLFSFAEGGSQHLYSVNLQGQDRKQVTNLPGIVSHPAYSPDGRLLACAATWDGNYDVYLLSVDGSNPRRLTDSPQQDLRPRWSPDGQRLAFTSNRDGNYEIYVMRADGTELTRVTRNPERDDYAAWMPDGKELVFVGERDGKQDLYLVPAPGFEE